MPDTKDWTWVLERPCPQCGFDASNVVPEQIGLRLRAATFKLIALLDDPLARRRPAPAVWSALEYGCHVRDVHRLYLLRLNLMLTEDAPHFANWDQDATAIESQYAGADPDGPEELAWALVVDSMIFATEAEVRWLDHTEQRLAQRPQPAIALELSTERPKRGRPAQTDAGLQAAAVA